MVRLAISAANSLSSRYSDVKGSAPKPGPVGPSRRSAGNRLRSVGRVEPWPWSGPSQPSSSPTFHRSAQSVRTTQEEPRDGSAEAISCTSRGKSSGPPGVGSAHTSSSRKSAVRSWILQGRAVCAVFGSLIRGLRKRVARAVTPALLLQDPTRCLHALEPRRHMLVPRGADERIAIARTGELVRRDSGGRALPGCDAQTVRQRDVPALHRRGDLDRHHHGSAAVNEPHALPVGYA